MTERRNATFALVFAALSCALVLGTAAVVWRFLSGHSMARPIAVGIGVVGLALAALTTWSLWRAPSRRLRNSLIAVGILLVASVCISFAYGRITFSRFGFTAYGLIPIPALDVTIDSDGILGFRVKSHQITLEEVQPLLGEDVQVVVIGIGWDSVAKVEESVRRLPGYDVRVLPTGEAFELFNRLVSEGERVVLLAHTTC